MKQHDKRKLSELINKIQSGEFDNFHIESLFIMLREEPGICELFREIGDFVAHREFKTKGLLHSTIERLAYRAVILTHRSANQMISLDQTLPIYFYNFFKYQIQDLKDDILKRNNYKRKELMNEFEKSFDINKTNSTMILKSTSTKKFVDALLNISQYMVVSSISQDDIIKSIYSALRNNNVAFDRVLFREQENKIILVLMMLIHKTKFKVRYLNEGLSQINIDNDFLIVSGHISHKDNDNAITLAIPLLNSNLKSNEWINEDVDLDDNIFIDKNFKLTNT